MGRHTVDLQLLIRLTIRRQHRQTIVRQLMGRHTKDRQPVVRQKIDMQLMDRQKIGRQPMDMDRQTVGRQKIDIGTGSSWTGKQ